ncbi:polymorphic toxin-type HINT domain-containing protein [Leptospira stimsonii]|uniref:polymorphic toxin-type HINT domain-containing protein n=1 Tax=Leptospira stimsonii TaxID=2202203 RepID=UPI0014386239|nr:polymorphic toxin-type HINT domain-containing protein [Leptospira stimsonii]
MSYNSYNGFSHSLAQQANGWDSIIASNQSSLMSHLEETSKNVAKENYALDQGMREYVSRKGMQISEKEWSTLSDAEKETLVQKIATGNTQHSTRDEFGERVWGAVTDFADQLNGKFSTDAGWMEKDPKTGEMVFKERTCFVAGTLVHTKDGLKKIEEIQVGDVVLSKSDKTGEVSYRSVVNTFVRQTDAIYKVSFEDETELETTWNHPFRTQKMDAIGQEFNVENTQWTEAKDLVAGNITLTVEGDTLKVTSILMDQRTDTVYNFEVEQNHTYFVSEVGVWVHNNDSAKYSTIDPNVGLKYGLFFPTLRMAADEEHINKMGQAAEAVADHCSGFGAIGCGLDALGLTGLPPMGSISTKASGLLLKLFQNAPKTAAFIKNLVSHSELDVNPGERETGIKVAEVFKIGIGQDKKSGNGKVYFGIGQKDAADVKLKVFSSGDVEASFKIDPLISGASLSTHEGIKFKFIPNSNAEMSVVPNFGKSDPWKLEIKKTNSNKGQIKVQIPLSPFYDNDRQMSVDPYK